MVRLGKLRLTVLSRPRGLKRNVSGVFIDSSQPEFVLTLVVKAVRPAAFSEVNLPDCGPGFGRSPLPRAFNSLIVLSGVKSS